MKDRLSKMSKKATHALCLLAACGLTYSCADEYKLDDEAPEWLGASIYDYLKSQGKFTNFVKMIDDLNMAEDLSKTGSRTLFVADDEAFNKFYASNANTPVDYAWHNATSYDKLTKSQKKVLVNTAMLNNAYLLEMLPRAQADGDGVPTKGANMRKQTIMELTDTVPFVKGGNIPYSLNEKEDKKYWEPYKKKGLYLMTDNTYPMMVYFIDEQMSKAGVTDEDFKYLTGKERSKNDVYIYFNKVLQQDITCQNGYVNVLDSILVPPGSMAEVIRTNGKSNIFSHILDRFSAPYYDESLTRRYRENIDPSFTDSIFVKKYYSENTAQLTGYTTSGAVTKHYSMVNGPDKEAPSTLAGVIKFDPAWHQYVSDASGSLNGDMAAMFVPTDKALEEYFLTGGGKDLIQNYGNKPNTKENLYHNIDQIPLNTLNSFISNLMQKSFTNTVPSKFGSILDQANDNLFPSPDKAKSEIEDVKIADNGAVYLMNSVYPPVDYAAVTSPAYIGKDYKIMKFAIYNGSGMDGKNNLLNLNYYAYLRAKGEGINFTLLLPSDQALQYYVDPISLSPNASHKNKARILAFEYVEGTTDKNVAPVKAKQYNYDPATNMKGAEVVGTPPNQTEALSRLKDILETHTIVHSASEAAGVESGNEYYLSKNGSPVHVKKANGKTVFQGATQIQMEKEYPGNTNPLPGYYYSETVEKYDKQNGTTYCLNAPIIPATESAYKIMGHMQDTLFFSLCNGVSINVLEETGIVEYPENASEADKEKEWKKYMVFINNKGLDRNIAFFNSFNYTIYVPKDDVLKAEIDTYKLPTWEKIETYIAEHREDPEWETKYKGNAARQVEILLDFIRGHFQDNSVFADKLAGKENHYNSATINPDNNKFVTITSQATGNGNIVLKKEGYYDCKVVGEKNRIARDYVTSVDYSQNQINLIGSTINSASYSVLHQIDGVLRTKLLKPGETYEKIWNKQENFNVFSARIRKKYK